MRPFALLLVMCVSVTPTPADEPKANAPDDPVRAKLEEAKRKYGTEIAAASERLKKAFDEQRAALKLNTKLTPDDRAMQDEVLDAERKAFEAKPTDLPKSEWMKKARAGYEESVKTARGRCEDAFSAAKKSYDARKDAKGKADPDYAAIKAVEAERDQFFKGGPGAVPSQRSIEIDWKLVQKGVGKITMAVLQDDRAGASETGTQTLSPDEFDKKVNSGATRGSPGSAYAVNATDASKATNAALLAWRKLITGLSNPRLSEKEQMALLNSAIKQAVEAEEAVGNPVVKKAFSEWVKHLSSFKKFNAAFPGAVKEALVGTWQVTVGDYKSTWTFKNDGTVTQSGSTVKDKPWGNGTGKWFLETDKNRVLIDWGSNTQDQIDLPIEPTGSTGSQVLRDKAKLQAAKK